MMPKFKGPKGMGSMGGGGMMQQLQKLQEQLAAAQAQLAEETVTSSAGGGAVKVTITGDQRCTAVEIDPELLKDGDVEMIQDLLMTAVNSALDKSRELAQDRLGPLASGLPL
jgi:DNA-binding YbaB/EbfC family protein